MSEATAQPPSIKKRAIKAVCVGSALALVLQTLFLGTTFMRLKSNGIQIIDLELDIKQKACLNITVGSELTSPLSLAISEIKTRVVYQIGDAEYNFVSVSCSDIAISSLSKLTIQTAITLDELDISKVFDLEPKISTYLLTDCKVTVYVVYIPITFTFTNFKTLLSSADNKVQSVDFFESLDDAKKQFLRLFSVESIDEQRKIENNEIFNDDNGFEKIMVGVNNKKTVQEPQKNIIQDAKAIQESLSAIDQDPKELHTSTLDATNNINITSKIIKEISYTLEDSFYKLSLKTLSFLPSDQIKAINIAISELSFIISEPFHTIITIQELKINKDENSVVILIKKLPNTDYLPELGKLLWGVESFLIKVDLITHQNNPIYKNTGNDNRALSLIAGETDVLLFMPTHTIFTDPNFTKHTIELDIGVCANHRTALFSSLIYSALSNSKTKTTIVMNDLPLFDIKLIPLNPFMSLQKDGKYFKLLRIVFDFDCATAELNSAQITSSSNTISHENGIKMFVKKDNVFVIKLSGYKGIAKELNNISLICTSDKLPVLKVGNTFIDAFVIIRTPKKIINLYSKIYRLYHNVLVPKGDELLTVSSLFKKPDEKCCLKKINFFSGPFSSLITANRFSLALDFTENFYISYDPPINQTTEGEVFGCVSWSTRLYELILSAQHQKNFYCDLIGKTFNLKLFYKKNDVLNFIIELDEGIFKDSCAITPDNDIIRKQIGGNHVADPALGKKTTIFPKSKINWISNSNMLGLSIGSEINDLESLTKLKNLNNSTIIINSIYTKKLAFAEEYNGLPISIETSEVPIDIIFADSELFVCVKQKMDLKFLMENENVKSVGFTNSAAIDNTKTKDAQADTKTSTPLGSTDTTKNSTVDLKKFITFLSSFSSTNYEQLPVIVPIPDENVAIGVNLKVVDEPKTGLKIESNIIIPLIMISPQVLDFLDFLEKITLQFNSGSSLLKLLIKIDKENITLSINGNFNIRVEEYEFSLSINGKREIHTTFNRTRVFESLKAKITNTLPSSQLENLTGNIPPSHIDDTKKAVNQSKGVVHIEPKQITAITALKTYFCFDIFIDDIHKTIGRSIGDAIANLALVKYPKFMNLNIQIAICEIFIKDDKDTLLSLGDLKCSVENKYQIPYEDNEIMMNHNEIKDLYSEDNTEIAYFEKNKLQISKKTKDTPISIQFSVKKVSVDYIIVSENIAETIRCCSPDSTIEFLYENFYEKFIAAEYNVKKETPEVPSGKPIKVMRCWVSPENYGAISAKLGVQINFIKSPFSIFVLSNSLYSIQMRLFGLQKDVKIEENNTFDNTFEFTLFDLEKCGKKIGKRCVDLVVLWQLNPIRVLSFTLPKSIVGNAKTMKNAYFSKFGKIGMQTVFALKDRFTHKKNIRGSLNTEKTIGYTFGDKNSEDWDGHLRFTSLIKIKEDDRKRAVDAI